MSNELVENSRLLTQSPAASVVNSRREGAGKKSQFDVGQILEINFPASGNVGGALFEPHKIDRGGGPFESESGGDRESAQELGVDQACVTENGGMLK